MEAISISSTRSLRNLYFIRTAFQVTWAAGIAATVGTQPQMAAVLFFLYPLWDVACTVYDLKTSARLGSARTSQIINALLGVAAAIGIGLTVVHQPTYAVAVFGAWALGAGLLQLVVGLIRRKQLGGQWAMILSGAQSTAAGVAFSLGGLSGKFHIKDLGGYAVFGAIYFLIAGLLLMRKLKLSVGLKNAVALSVALAALLVVSNAYGEHTPIRQIVLVHDSLTDSKSWEPVTSLLEKKGYKVTAVQLPLTSLADDVSAVEHALAPLEQPVVLVGHGYGGVVITEAGMNPKVARLVYIAAYAPDDRQSAEELVKQFPPPAGASDFRREDNGTLVLTGKGVDEDLAQDLSPSEKTGLASSQHPVAGQIFSTPVGTAAWRQKPSWFIVATNDRIISPQLERDRAKAIHAKITVIHSSHLPMLSKPVQVSEVIESAAGGPKSKVKPILIGIGTMGMSVPFYH